MRWLATLRLSMTLLAFLLVVISFKIVGHLNEAWLPATSVFLISTAIAFQNNWRDRFHDLAIGRTLATEKPKIFLFVTFALWLVALGSVLIVLRLNLYGGTVLMAFIILGVFYSETRLVPLLPLIITSIVSGGFALLPLAYGYDSPRLWVLFWMIFWLIFCRDSLKDLIDYQVDLGYKKTLPTLIGISKSKFLIGALLIILGVAAAAMKNYIFGSPFLIVAGIVAILSGKYLFAKRILDIGAALVLISMFLN